MSDELKGFEQFMKRREAASAAYVQGEMEPLSEIITRSLPATFLCSNRRFSSWGGRGRITICE